MQIFLRQGLAFLAVPKTGTTAVEVALKPQAEIIFAKERKHMNARKYHARVVPFVRRAFGVRLQSFAVMRDPLDHMGSWFRYRNRDALDGTDASAKGVTFDAFVRAAMQSNPPAYARVGSQFEFLTDRNGVLAVDHLFAYDSQIKFRTFLQDQFDQDIVLKPKNVSPNIATKLPDTLADELRAARPEDAALYARLKTAGGYLAGAT